MCGILFKCLDECMQIGCSQDARAYTHMCCYMQSAACSSLSLGAAGHPARFCFPVGVYNRVLFHAGIGPFTRYAEIVNGRYICSLLICWLCAFGTAWSMNHKLYTVTFKHTSLTEHCKTAIVWRYNWNFPSPYHGLMLFLCVQSCHGGLCDSGICRVQSRIAQGSNTSVLPTAAARRWSSWVIGYDQQVMLRQLQFNMVVLYICSAYFARHLYYENIVCYCQQAE